MASSIFRFVLNATATVYKCNGTSKSKLLHTASTNYAARKGTREKARAKKVKVEVTKVGFIPHNQRKKGRTTHTRVDKHANDLFKKIATDDVFPMRYFRWPVLSVQEAVKAHQQTHHPTMYNMTDALVFAKVELNMKAIKKNKFLDNFSKISLLPHNFPRDEQRTILVFCKGQELQNDAEQAGGTTVGGGEIIKKIQQGELKLSDYDYVVAHPNILTDLVPIRGLLKRKFPTLHGGTLGQDIAVMVKKFAAGIQYKATKDEHQQDYACIEVPIGRINMESKHIEENFEELLKDINVSRPKREGLFVTRCFVVCPPSKIHLKVDPFVFIPQTLAQDDNSDDEEEVAVKA